MNSGAAPKSIALLFVAGLALYLASFYGCEYVRHRQGAWEVQFRTNAAGHPAIVVSQPKLNLSAVQIVFVGEKTPRIPLPQTVVFKAPRQRVPFGRVVFEDLTYLPGVVTFDFFGHEIELLPRVLAVNRREVPWQSGHVIELSAKDKPAEPFKPPVKPRRSAFGVR
jgi:hypothetical protein